MRPSPHFVDVGNVDLNLWGRWLLSSSDCAKHASASRHAGPRASAGCWDAMPIRPLNIINKEGYSSCDTFW